MHESNNLPLNSNCSAFSFLAPSPLQSSLIPVPAGRPFDPGTTYQGFRRLSGISTSIRSTRGFPPPRHLPSSGFLNLSTVFPARWFHESVSPRSHLRDSSVQGFLAPHSMLPSSESIAPLSFPPRRSPTCVGCHTFGPRLRGFDPHEVALPVVWF
jgi:hypothetical protein